MVTSITHCRPLRLLPVMEEKQIKKKKEKSLEKLGFRLEYNQPVFKVWHTLIIHATARFTEMSVSVSHTNVAGRRTSWLHQVHLVNSEIFIQYHKGYIRQEQFFFSCYFTLLKYNLITLILASNSLKNVTKNWSRTTTHFWSHLIQFLMEI